jgi:hypothetical protein
LCVSTLALGFGASEAESVIIDKTLVAWVRLENTDQQGGSALTLFDDAEHFDAIVFGEVQPRRWMAGSDFFRRTPQDQASYPVEQAAPGELLQIAIAYQGRVVTVYRDGFEYASFPIEAAQAFGLDSVVLVGLRYLGAMGAIGPLAGEVEEARIYDVALSRGQIAGLRLGVVSDPRPVGWWTFDGGSTADLAGNFPDGQLRGGATIVNGALRLNGTGAYMVCAPEYPENQLMFYKALDPGTGNMWDTWLYLHEGVYYLYYLANRGPSWDNISAARSPDGVHWEELGPVLRKREGVDWMGTGSTWTAPPPNDGDRFIMNFSEWRGPRQTIFFAESPDLTSWHRLPDACEFVQDTRWYKADGRWDCIYTIPRPEGGLYGYWTADPLRGPSVGFGQSLDGVTWQALEPPRFVEGSPHGEAGAVERIGERYYLMLGANGGMRTLVADTPEGPFAPATTNFDLLAGQSGMYTYFARFFRTPNGVLVNHHSRMRNGQVYFAPLKRALVDERGTLRLGWWEGNNALKRDAALIHRPLSAKLDTTAGIIVEGGVALPADGAPTGVWLGMRDGGRVRILLGPQGVTCIGAVDASSTEMAVEETVDRETAFPARCPFRLLVKHSLVEFYLNGVLMQCYSMPARSDGRLGVMGSVDRLRAWQLPGAASRP